MLLYLKQGLRLLVSTCDFIFFDAGAPKHPLAPALWRLTTRAAGTMRGLTPAADQSTARPHIRYSALARDAHDGPHARSVNTKPLWSLGEVLTEPLFYNANLGNWWGSRILDPVDWELHHRATHRQAWPLRWSANRTALAMQYYTLSQQCAHWGLTHVVHLLAPYIPGTTPRLLTYAELFNRSLHPPLSRDQFSDLIAALPLAWHATLNNTTTALPPPQSLQDLHNA